MNRLVTAAHAPKTDLRNLPTPPGGRSIRPASNTASVELSFPSVEVTADSTQPSVNWGLIVGLLGCLAVWGAVALGIAAAV